MTPDLRDRIVKKLETLSDERGYQLLDYAEFLESKYADRAAAASDNLFARFASGVEETLRAGKVNASTVAQAMGFMNQAMGVLSGVAAAGKSVVNDVATVGKSVASDLAATAQRVTQPSTPAASVTAPAAAAPAAPVAPVAAAPAPPAAPPPAAPVGETWAPPPATAPAAPPPPPAAPPGSDGVA
jgi:hypothetical protein